MATRLLHLKKQARILAPLSTTIIVVFKVDWKNRKSVWNGGFTDSQLGLTGSIFLWVYGIGCPIAGQIGDKFSKRRLIVWSLAPHGPSDQDLVPHSDRADGG